MHRRLTAARWHGCGYGAALLICWGWNDAAYAGDWPQWRGPTGTAHAVNEDLADSWPAGGPPLLWSRELGQGYSAFVIAEGRAYTQTQSLYEQSLICLDVDTGATLWSHRYDWPYDGGGLYPGPRSTPAVVQGRVYWTGPDGTVGCVEARTGRPIWSTNLKQQYRGRGTDFGVAASPVVWNELVILPVGGPTASLVAMEAETGNVRWTCGELPASYATPFIIQFAGQDLVIAPLENSLLCAVAATGQKLWELDLSEGYDEHSAAPLYREPYLLLAGPFRSGASCWELVADGTAPGCRPVPVWEAPKLSNDIASSVSIGEHIYGFDLKDIQSRLHRPSRGEFRCLNWTTGAVAWSSPDPGHANIIVADDKLLLFNDRGELRLAEVSSAGYRELGHTSVFPDEICWTPAALSKGRVLLRTQTRAACLYVGREPLQTAQPVQQVTEVVTVTRFDAAPLLGGEREFPGGSPETSELQRWFAATAGAVCVAWVLAGLAGLLLRWADVRMDAVFLGLVIVAGAVGSAALHRLSVEYWFTWPLALWGLMQLAVVASYRAIQPPGSRRAAWMARGAILAFVAGCGLYFHLCRKLGLATEWSFLTGFVAAYPVALLGEWFRQRQSRGQWWWSLPIELGSYATYYWACVGFMRYWLRIGS